MKIESLLHGDRIRRACAEQEQLLPEQRGRTARRLANVDLLLEAISQLDQAPLAPGLSQNIHSDRHAQRGCGGRRRENNWYGEGPKPSNSGEKNLSVGLIKFGQPPRPP